MNPLYLRELERELAHLRDVNADLVRELADTKRQLSVAMESLEHAAKTTYFRGPMNPKQLYDVREFSRFGGRS